MLTPQEKRLYLGVALVVLFFSLLTLLKPPVVSLTIKTPAIEVNKWSLNSATRAQLQSIKGVGPVIARNIINRREQLHGFKSWADVLTVKGIGQKKLKLLQDNVCLDLEQITN